jgi:uncharacterized protein (TIGR02996 family)
VQALEEGIRARVDAWEPWLVYADWLSEQGDARGRLIGLEHRREIATLDADELRELEAELAELVAVHEPSWLIPNVPETWGFIRRHGFVVGLSLPLDEPGIEALASWLRQPQARLLMQLHVHVVHNFEEAHEAFDGHFEIVPPSEALVRGLFELDLARLTSLDLRYNYLADAGVEALTRCRSLSGLTTLRLQRNRIGPDGARALADAAQLGNLTVLDLRENPLGSPGAAALAGSANFRRLRTLYLYRDDIGVAGARALADSKHLPIHIRRYWAGQWSAANEQASKA